MAEPVISIQGVSCGYVSRHYGLFGKKTVKPVLDNINLDIAAGEIFGLAGESGCGKTTLARCILGLINYKGAVYIDGQRQQPGTRHGCSGKAQMIFQDPGTSLNPEKKIGWLLEEPLAIRKIGSFRQRSARVDEMLLRVGLDPSCKSRRPDEISGGQKQRACIGRALMLEPKILIADEAINALDLCAGAQILNLFQELQKSLSLTIVFITHNIGAAEYLCSRIAVMRDGNIGPVQKLC